MMRLGAWIDDVSLAEDKVKVGWIISQGVRADDRAEWEAAAGVPFEVSLVAALESPNPKWAAYYGWEPVMLFGVNPSQKGEGVAWMVATHTAVKHVHELHRLYREALGEMLAVAPTLLAWADSRNTMHHRWMRMMGWKDTGARLPFGKALVPFHLYTYTKEIHAECASR